MNVLVAYGSRLGSTREIAERITTRLGTQGIDATISSAEAAPDVSSFDAVLIGSAVYAGHWLDSARQFVEANETSLSSLPVWLFSSGPVGRLPTGADPIPPAEVRGLMTAIGARGHRVFAGALDRSSIDGADFPFIERVVAKRFVPEGDFREWAGIEAWADEIARELLRLPRPASTVSV